MVHAAIWVGQFDTNLVAQINKLANSGTYAIVFGELCIPIIECVDEEFDFWDPRPNVFIDLRKMVNMHFIKSRLSFYWFKLKGDKPFPLLKALVYTPMWQWETTSSWTSKPIIKPKERLRQGMVFNCKKWIQSKMNLLSHQEGRQGAHHEQLSKTFHPGESSSNPRRCVRP